MRKWAFFIAATFAVIGCGGSSGDSGTSGSGGSGGGTTGTSLQTKLNPDYGTVQFTYITGQGRATGDLTAVVRNLEIEDSVGLERTILETPHHLPLNQYVLDSVRLNIPFTGQSARLFESFPLLFSGFEVESSSGTAEAVTPPAPESFVARIRVLPGRDTCVPIFVDDSMFSLDGTTNTVAFDRAQFELRNGIESATDPILTYFSDYVSWDISGLPASARPQLSSGEVATRVYLSGDNYAVSANGVFEVLTLDSTAPLVGSYGDEGTIGGRTTPGTYTLRQVDPTDLFGIAQITAAVGVWRDSTRALTGFGTFDFMLFPTSRYEAPNSVNGNGLRPDEDQELMIVQRNGATITNIYFGYADLATGEFSAYPIKNLVNAGIDDEISGTLSGFKSKSGSSTTSFDLVRTGTFQITTGTAPSGFPNSGTFFVYRV